MGRLEVEAAAVAQPAPVDRVGVDAEVAHELVARRLHDGAAADAARRARALDLLEVPRPGLEAVRRRGQRADRADLHRVAGEVRRERLVRERHHLGLVAALHEADQRVAGDLVGEAGAAVAQDAALAVEQHEVADRDRLLEVALLLDVAALARAVAERLVLQRALAALVAHRAVQRVVGEQQLEDALLGPLRRRRLGVDLHVRRHRDHARRRQLRTAAAVDLDEAHPAHADRAHPVVPAEPRDVRAGALGGGDDQLALAGRERPAVDRDGDGVGVGLGLGCGASWASAAWSGASSSAGFG